jgi:hypothetical protein
MSSIGRVILFKSKHDGGVPIVNPLTDCSKEKLVQASLKITLDRTNQFW